MTTFNEDVAINGNLEVIPSDYSKPWLQLGQGGDAGRFRVEYPQSDSGYSLAPNLVMSDLDDPPRIRFQQIGSQTEAEPEFESWIGHAKGTSSDLAIIGGCIGIGTTNPQAALEVIPSDYSKPWLQLGQGGDAGRFRVEYPQSDSGYSLAPNLVMSDLDDPPRIRFQQIGSQTEAEPEFESWIGHARGRSNDLAIMGDNVGIGTASPQAKLDVNGDIKVKDWTLSVPDYVFDQDYELRNLRELRTYIDRHKHLPEMPSAQKVSEEGVNLGEFCMSLLKKIEELSLYVLQQEEIIQGQNERLAKLERSARV